MRVSHGGRLAVLGLCAQVLGTAAAGAGSAPVRFANSCRPEVQADFANAVTLLHSFEYPESARIFRDILGRDPGCAMARWGAAMSLWHPLWAPPGPADLEAGAQLLASAESLAPTEREAAYIRALQEFFSSVDPASHGERARAYEVAMSRVYAGHLEDPEAAVFYALALLATADPHDKSYAHQYHAAALLNWVREAEPDHPGVLHYLIHSYDYPGLAHLALGVARTYAQAAPASAHAQHMPSHIFTRLGLWELSLASNQDSTRSAAEYTQRAELHGHYDEGLHSIDYLMYAMLQTARDEEARELLAGLREITKTEPESFKVAYTYAASPARYALERHDWAGASRLGLEPAEFPWERFLWAKSIHHFARGIGAARSDDVGSARVELEAITRLAAELPEATLPYWREQVHVHEDAVGSWILLREGDLSSALRMAARAADREDAVDKHPVTPGEVLPARELFADMLLESHRGREALEEYRRVLAVAPNRFNSLLGAARAAASSGDAETARHYYGILRDQSAPGERAHAALLEAGDDLR